MRPFIVGIVFAVAIAFWLAVLLLVMIPVFTVRTWWQKLVGDKVAG